MPTTVIHISAAPKGWRKNPAFIYIGAGSEFRNLWTIGDPDDNGTPMTRARALLHWVDYIDDAVETNPEIRRLVGTLIEKTLVCHCKPRACHGDRLAQWANKISGKQAPMFDVADFNAHIKAITPPGGMDAYLEAKRKKRLDVELEIKPMATLAGKAASMIDCYESFRD